MRFSIFFQNSYHSTPKIRDIESQGDFWVPPPKNHLGGLTCSCSTPGTTNSRDAILERVNNFVLENVWFNSVKRLKKIIRGIVCNNQFFRFLGQILSEDDLIGASKYL